MIAKLKIAKDDTPLEIKLGKLAIDKASLPGERISAVEKLFAVLQEKFPKTSLTNILEKKKQRLTEENISQKNRESLLDDIFIKFTGKSFQEYSEQGIQSPFFGGNNTFRGIPILWGKKIISERRNTLETLRKAKGALRAFDKGQVSQVLLADILDPAFHLSWFKPNRAGNPALFLFNEKGQVFCSLMLDEEKRVMRIELAESTENKKTDM